MKTGTFKTAVLAATASIAILITGCGKKTPAPPADNTAAFQQAVANFLQAKSYGLKAASMTALKSDSEQAVVSCVITGSSRRWEFSLKKDAAGGWTVATFDLK